MLSLGWFGDSTRNIMSCRDHAQSVPIHAKEWVTLSDRSYNVGTKCLCAAYGFALENFQNHRFWISLWQPVSIKWICWTNFLKETAAFLSTHVAAHGVNLELVDFHESKNNNWTDHWCFSWAIKYTKMDLLNVIILSYLMNSVFSNSTTTTPIPIVKQQVKIGLIYQNLPTSKTKMATSKDYWSAFVESIKYINKGQSTAFIRVVSRFSLLLSKCLIIVGIGYNSTHPTARKILLLASISYSNLFSNDNSRCSRLEHPLKSFCDSKQRKYGTCSAS